MTEKQPINEAVKQTMNDAESDTQYKSVPTFYAGNARGIFFSPTQLWALQQLGQARAHDRAFNRKAVDAVINNGPKEAVLNIENAVIRFRKFNQTDGENVYMNHHGALNAALLGTEFV